MKLRRFISALLFGAGCAMICAGLIALVISRSENQQIQLLLASFFAPAENGFVRAMNAALRFTLHSSGRVVLLGVLTAACGAGLMLYFSPRQRKRPARKRRAMPSSPSPSAAKTNNPFAVETHAFPLPASKPRRTDAFRAAPTPETNGVGHTAGADDEHAPYDFKRFERESRAIETESRAESQSGSRLLIRTSYTPSAPSRDCPRVQSAPPLPDPPAAQAMPSPVSRPSSPRIRSTMGRRDSTGSPEANLILDKTNGA